MQKVAVVSICANTRVLPPEGSGLMGLVSSAEQKDEMDLSFVNEEMYKRVMKYERNFPFKYIDESEILENDDFQDWKEQEGDKGYLRSIHGYANVAPNDEETLVQSFKFLPKETNGVLAVDMGFQYIASGGIGPLTIYKVSATMHMTIHDRNGEEIMRIRQAGRSDGTIKAIAGAFNAKDTQKLALEASKDVFARMDDYIAKKMKK